LFKIKLKSHKGLGEIFFGAATIHKWIHLLKPDEMKDFIIGSLVQINFHNSLQHPIFSKKQAELLFSFGFHLPFTLKKAFFAPKFVL
jgi:hypothetical protein